MPLYRASLQTLGAIVLLVLALACHGKSGNGTAPTAILSGVVTYQRVPLAKDAQGKPTGLVDATVASNLQSLPARGVYVRIYQKTPQTAPDGSITYRWLLDQFVRTDSSGFYSANIVTGTPTMVEVLSTFDGGTGLPINLVAEPQGINSPTLVVNRLEYAMRKAPDGTAPAGVTTPASSISANTLLNFSIGLNDVWWVANPIVSSADRQALQIDQAVLETSFPGRTSGLGSGSRILGIGDTIASFVAAYGSASPGSTLDLHYWLGRSEPGGSYVVYDQSLFPQAYDPLTGAHYYFGTLRGDPANDDAWDAGVILPLLAHNVLYAGNRSRTYGMSLNPIFPVGAPLVNLSPDQARIEGLAQAMSANVLKSPYLADTMDTGLAGPVIDVRDIGGLDASQLGPFSAPAIRAFAWEIILKANGLPSPGLPADWANINYLAAARFFVAPTSPTGVAGNGIVRDIEPLNVFSQITRLKEVKASTEPVDLVAIFTDAVLTSLGTPFGIAWPRPSTGPYSSFVTDWGTDPTGAFPPVVMSMAKATQVDLLYPNVSLAYPNASQGEVFYTGFNLSVDKRCTLSATITPALGAGAQVDVDLPFLSRTFSFTGSGGSTGTIVIPVYITAPVYHPMRLRLNSPSSLQPDVTVTLTLTPVP